MTSTCNHQMTRGGKPTGHTCTLPAGHTGTHSDGAAWWLSEDWGKNILAAGVLQ